MSTKQGTNLKLWNTHPDTKRLGLVRAGDDTAVIVRRHHNGLAFQLRVKAPFTGRIEVVAIDEGEDGQHGNSEGVDHTRHHTPNLKGLLRSDFDRLVVLILR